MFINKIFGTLFFLICVYNVSGQNKPVTFLPSSYFLHSPVSYGADPDLPTIRISKNGKRWNNMIGAHVPLLAVNYKNRAQLLFASGFVNTHDFKEGTGSALQMWRSSMALGSRLNLFSFSFRRKWSNVMFLQLAYGHENDRVNDYNNYFNTVTYPLASSSDSFKRYSSRSFSYLEIKPMLLAIRKGKLRNSLALRYRFFGGSNQVKGFLRQSVALDYAVEYDLSWNIFIYGAVFLESTLNNMVADPSVYRIAHNKEPFMYQNIEFGIRIKNAEKRAFDIYLSQVKGAGRGMDFLIDYRKQWGLGLKVTI